MLCWKAAVVSLSPWLNAGVARRLLSWLTVSGIFMGVPRWALPTIRRAPVAAPAWMRKAWMGWQIGTLAVIEIVVALVLIIQISQGEMIAEGVAILAGLIVVDVVLYLLIRRAARQGEFRDYDDEESSH